jgi:hypothetical protein
MKKVIKGIEIEVLDPRTLSVGKLYRKSTILFYKGVEPKSVTPDTVKITEVTENPNGSTTVKFTEIFSHSSREHKSRLTFKEGINRGFSSGVGYCNYFSLEA